MALTRDDLDHAACDDCGGTGEHGGPLHFHAACHPDWPTWARYENGELIITCSQDEREVARVAVASG